MKRIRDFLYKTAFVWMFIIFVGILFGLPSRSELGIEWMSLRVLNLQWLATLLVLAVAIVILSGLRYRFAWFVVLVVLGILRLGIDPPQLGFYPEQLSIVRVSWTLVAILVFWVVEKLESKYVGLNFSTVRELDSLTGEDEIVRLNLKEKNQDK